MGDDRKKDDREKKCDAGTTRIFRMLSLSAVWYAVLALAIASSVSDDVFRNALSVPQSKGIPPYWQGRNLVLSFHHFITMSQRVGISLLPGLLVALTIMLTSSESSSRIKRT